MVPKFISQLLETIIGAKRIQKFFDAEEIDISYINSETPNNEKIALSIKKGNFYWENDEDNKHENSTMTKSGDDEDTKIQKPNKHFGNSDRNKKTIDQENLIELTIMDPSKKNLIHENNLTLKDVNLEIKKGSFVALIGEYI